MNDRKVYGHGSLEMHVPDNPFGVIEQTLVRGGFETSTSEVQRLVSHVGGHAGWVAHLWGILPGQPTGLMVGKEMLVVDQIFEVRSIHVTTTRPAKRHSEWWVANCHILTMEGASRYGVRDVHSTSMGKLEGALRIRTRSITDQNLNGRQTPGFSD